MQIIIQSLTGQSPGHNAKHDDDHPHQSPNLNDEASTSIAGRNLTKGKMKKEPVEKEKGQEKCLVNVSCVIME